ncbi:MAG: hypothetical protein ACI9ES_000576 [Oceanospirillaceae bacterium]
MTNKPIDPPINNPIIIDPRMLNNYYAQDDEISLVDLWLSMVKQKNILFSTMLAVIVMAIVYIVIVPETYTYKTEIAIGTQTQTQTQAQAQAQAQAQLIQSPETIVASLDNAIIPKILMQQHLTQPDNQLDVSASIPKNTDSVLLTSKGTIAQKEAIAKLHQHLITILAESHQNKIQNTLGYLNDELISSQSMLVKLNKKLQSSAGDNEQITLQVINLENNIRQTKRSIAEFTPTRSAMGTVQSVKPTNKSSKLILAVSIVLGLFLGIFAALFAGFIAKVKEQVNAQ